MTSAHVDSAMVLRLRQSKLFREYQQAFETTTGLPLMLREIGSFRTPLQGSKRMNPFCGLMTQKNETCAACLQLQQRVEAEATLGPKTLQCYAGLSESSVPVRVGDKVIGYLQTGQVFLRSPSKQRFKSFIRGLPAGGAGADPHAWESAYFRTRVIPKSAYESVLRLLAIFAEHLATVSNQMVIIKATAEPAVITKGRTFIIEHYSEDLSLRDVARAVNMSVCYFCKIFKKGTGLSFTEFLARERIEAVKQMLLNAHMRVSEAAFAAGFQSLSQFNRVFRRVAGEAPSSYRSRIHGLHRIATRTGVLIRAA